MALQIINQVLPCGKPADVRTLTASLQVGQNLDEGDIADDVDIVDGEKYVVTGTGTITYNSTDYDVGEEFDGVAGETDFTRSVPEARVIRVEEAVAGTSVDNAYYIVSGSASTDTITYPEGTGGVSMSPGTVFRGESGFEFVRDVHMDTQDPPQPITNNVVVYKIKDNDTIEILTMHKLGAIGIPNFPGLDNSESLGVDMNNGAAIPDPNGTLSRIYVWNFGTSPATVYFRAFIPQIDADLGAARRDISDVVIPANGVSAFEWPPTELFRQGANNTRYNTTEADRQASLSAYIIQTASTNKDIWIKPESDLSLGVQNKDA